MWHEPINYRHPYHVYLSGVKCTFMRRCDTRLKYHTFNSKMKILVVLNTIREFYTHAYLFTGRKALWCQELSSAEKKANNKAGWVSCTLGYLPKLTLDLQNLWLKTLFNSTTFLRKTIHVQIYLKISFFSVTTT